MSNSSEHGRDGKRAPEEGFSPSPEASEQTTRDLETPVKIPKKIGHYTIKRVIGSGGMGVVYEAVQEHPRRSVAIKVVKHGVASRSALRRFEYESQILARLRHPCIAQVYEAVTHDDGSGAVPFFAMEYIPNAKPITRYAEEKKLTTRERLELFARVCDGVHHGHQKGIIHRDLKPSNILVDSHGQPRVIDFGVARAIDSDMAITTLQTEVGQLIGTLQYMSPEQCEADPNDIDTRSDIYALGVVLYHLLTGQLPYDVAGLPVHEAARLIREQTPRKVTATDPTLRGDVETIVQKALEKDRERRYQSTFGLAQDIRRYLAGEAIAARAPSVAYLLRVFARRNKTLLGAVAAVLVVLVSGIIVSASMYLRAQAEQERADQQGNNALAAISYLEQIMGSADPTEVGEEVKIADLLDRYGASLDKAFPGQPGVEATVRTKLGDLYKLLDLFYKRGTAENYQRAARNHLEAALDLRLHTVGEQHPDTLVAMSSLASLLEAQERLSEAESLYRRGLEISQRVHGEEAPDTLALIIALADCLHRQGSPGAAEPLARRALEARRRVVGEEDHKTLESKFQVAWLLQAQGNLSEAEPLYRTVWEVRRRILGDADKDTRDAMAGLANVLLAQGRLVEAERLYGGAKVPEDLGIERWFQGKTDPYGGRATLLVFWEEWCPWCQRYLPPLEKLYGKYKDRDLRMIGLTRMTQSATEGKVGDFIRYNNLSFPIAQEDGTATSFFNKNEKVPAVAVVKGGRLVWSGHPDYVTDEMLEALLRKITDHNGDT